MLTIRSRTLLAAAAACLLIGAGSASAEILVQIPGVKGDSTLTGFEGWFVADSFSFGVEREMKESGEKGGTEDINIGVGELQEVTVSKSIDSTSAHLAQFAINGNSLGTVDIVFVQNVGGRPVAYLTYKLERCFVKSWSTSGDADDRPTEEVAFYYNKIAFNYASTTDGKSSGAGWDRVKNVPHSMDPGAVKLPPTKLPMKVPMRLPNQQQR